MQHGRSLRLIRLRSSRCSHAAREATLLRELDVVSADGGRVCQAESVSRACGGPAGFVGCSLLGGAGVQTEW